MSKRLGAVMLGIALLAGVALRVHQLPGQIVFEDELFPLRALVEKSYATLFDSLGFGYTSIPQTLLARAIADGLGLDEVTYRLPSLIGGLTLLGVVAGFAWRRFGASVAVAATALVAISPVLVFYSRFARPYALATCLVFLGLLAFDRWLERGRGRDAITYVLAGAGAIWLHLLAVVPVLALPLAGGLYGMARADRGERLAALLAPLFVGGAVVSVAGMLLFRPVFLGWPSLSTKSASVSIPMDTVVDAARHLAGTGSGPLALGFWLGVAVGGVLLWRRAPRLFWLIAASTLLPWLTVGLARPFLAQLHWVFARYLTWTLPACLLLLSIAIAELGRLRVAGRRWPLPLLGGVAVVGALFATGPLPGAYAVPNNFTHHDDFQVAYWGERPSWREAGAKSGFTALRTATPEPSVFYDALRDEPGTFAIVEGPWFGRWELAPFHHDQRRHGRPVVAGWVGITPGVGPFALDDPRLSFRQLVDLRRPESWDRDDLRYVVLHRSVGAETTAPEPAFDLAPLLAQYTERFGAPVFEDARIVVFRVSEPVAR